MLRSLIGRLARLRRGPNSGERAPESSHEVSDRLIALGNRAEEAGRPADACVHYRAAVAAAPRYAKAHLNLGIGLSASDEPEVAAIALKAALAIEPGNPYAHYNLGRLLMTGRALQDAERHLRAALESRPEFPEALAILAAVLEAKGAAVEAAEALERALVLQPLDFGTLYRYGMLLAGLNRLPEAERCLRSVLELMPEHDDACAALFDVLRAQGNLPAALAEIEALLRRQPDRADTWYRHGLALMGLERLDAAEAAFRKVLDLDPRYAPAYRMLGNVLHRCARIAELVALCRVGRGYLPERFDLESFELLALNFLEGMSAQEIAQRHRSFGERLERTVPSLRGRCNRARDPERRLRVAFVSGEFSYHPVTLFLLPLLEHLDRQAFEVVCYSSGSTEDDFTRRVRERADSWRSVGALADRDLAYAMQDDGIDVAVDLSGHSGISRLVAFAHCPAPVQVAWLGYLNTTGLTRIQYRICDARTDPPGVSDALHTERLIRLPHSQWCYRPFVESQARPAPPCVQRGFVTFGSFNQAAKISDTSRRLWAQILTHLPSSRLFVVGVPVGLTTDRLLREFAGYGIDARRLTVLPHLPLADYYASFDEVDIALDTHPYSGGTTTCDTLWMGVPVLTLPGERAPSRSAASVLSTVGLDGWIASTTADYVRLAVERAMDSGNLARLRGCLRRQLHESALMDAPGFAREFERELRQLWRRWCGCA